MSPVDILYNTALAIREHQIGGGEAVSIQPIPLKLHIGKHTASIYEVDASKTSWERSISSVWPHLPLERVQPDPYRLRLELSDAAGNLIDQMKSV